MTHPQGERPGEERPEEERPEEERPEDERSAGAGDAEGAAAPDAPAADASTAAAAPMEATASTADAAPTEAAAPTADAAPTEAAAPASAEDDGWDQTEAASPPAKKKARGRWWRRLKLVALSLLVLVLIVRAVLPIFLPDIIDGVMEGFGLQCDYELLELSVLGGDVELWHLSIGPRDAGQAYLKMEYCRADIAVFQLLLGNLIVRRLEVDGLEVRVERAPDGSLPLLEHFAAAEPEEDPEEPEEPEEEPEAAPGNLFEGLSFDSPVRLDAARLQRVTVRLVDRMQQPARRVRFDIDLRLSDLGAAVRPLLLQASIHSPEWLDLLRMEARVRTFGTRLETRAGLDLRGLRLARLAPYLEPLGIIPEGPSLSVEGGLDLGLRLDGGTLGGRLKIGDCALRAGRTESAGLDSLVVRFSGIGGESLRVPVVTVAGGRLRAARNAAGEILAAGLRILPGGPPADSAAVPADSLMASAPAAEVPADTAEAASDELPLHLLPVVRVLDCAVAFDDAALLPPGPDGPETLALRFGLDSLRVAPLHERGQATGVGLTVACGIDDFAGSIAGRLDVWPTMRSVRLDGRLRVRGIGFEPIAPLLAPLGLRSRYRAGSLELSAGAAVELDEDGGIHAAAGMEGFRLADGDEDLLRLGRMRLSGARVDAALQNVELDTIQVSGLRLAASRDEEGTIDALGFLVRPPEPSSEDEAQEEAGAAGDAGDAGGAEAPASAPADSGGLPPGVPSRIVLHHLAVGDNAIAFSDPSLPPLAADDLGLELDEVVARLDELRVDIGSYAAWAELPGLIERLDARGALRGRPKGGSLSLAGELSGLSFAKAEQFLEPLGIETTLRAGSAGLRLGAELDVAGDTGLVASLAIADVFLRDGEEELVGLDSLHVDNLRAVLPATVKLDAVRIAGPRLAAARDAEGAITALGVRVPLPLPRVPEGPTPGPSPGPRPGPAPDTGPAEPEAPLDLVAMLDTFRVRNLAVRWRDDAVEEPLETALRLDVEVGPIALGPPPPETSLAVDVALDGSLDGLAVRGAATVTLESQDVALRIRSHGLRAGALGAYLPAQLAVPLTDGRLSLDLDVSHGPAPDGGLRAWLAMRDFLFADGDQELVRVGGVRADVPRVDLEAGLVRVRELVVEGVATSAALGADGSLRLPGLTVLPPDTSAAATAALAPAEEAPPTRAPGAATPVLDAEGPGLPLVEVERLVLQADRLRFEQEGREAVGISGFAVENRAPIRVLGPEPAEQPGIALAIGGRVDPVCESLRVAIDVDPFAFEPELKVRWGLSGISGPALAAVVPQLEESFEVSGLTDGRAAGELELHLSLRRAGPFDFPVDRPFGLELTVKDVSWKNGVEGPVLLGLDQLTVDAERIDIAKPEVYLRAVEIYRPIARVTKRADGIHVAGLVLKLPPPDTTAPALPEVEPLLPDTRAAQLRAEARNRRVGRGRTVQSSGLRADNPAEDWPEFALNRFLFTGIDVEVIDESVEPPAHLPIRELDIEVQGISRRALLNEQAIPFSLRTSIASVPDPREPGQTMRGMEGLSITGNVIALPTPLGGVTTVLRELQLVNFAGLAAQQGLNIDDGTLEMVVETEFIEDGVIVDADIEMASLDVSEARSGLVASYLGLSAPLNAILFALENSRGGISIPMTIEVGWAGVDVESIAARVLSSLTLVVAEALASVPLRLVSSFGDWFKFWEPGPITIDLTEELDFEPAAVSLPRSEREALQKVCARFFEEEGLELSLRSLLGAQDLARAARLANPTPEIARDLVKTMRNRKEELLGERKQLVAEARAASAAQRSGASAAFASRLRALDRELGELEASLDDALAILRPGAERKADRRTRAASLAISARRLEYVRKLCIDFGVPAERIRVVPPRYGVPGSEQGLIEVGLGAGL